MKKTLDDHSITDKQALDKERKDFQKDAKELIRTQMANPIENKVKEEVEKAVGESMERHIKDYLPVSLQDQAKQNDLLLKEIEIARDNS